MSLLKLKKSITLFSLEVLAVQRFCTAKDCFEVGHEDTDRGRRNGPEKFPQKRT